MCTVWLETLYLGNFTITVTVSTVDDYHYFDWLLRIFDYDSVIKKSRLTRVWEGIPTLAPRTYAPLKK